MKSAALALMALTAAASADPLTYPAARRDALVESLHGTSVPDPYRWMEDIDSPETRKWVEAQADLANSYLTAIPQRATFLKRLRELQDYDKLGVPQLAAGRLFYSKKQGLQNQAVVYWREDRKDATDHVLFDPNTSSAGSNSAAPHGARTARASTTAATPNPKKARNSKPKTTTRRSTTTPSANLRTRTVSSTPDPTSQNGASTPPNPKTVASSSSSSTRAPNLRNASSTAISPKALTPQSSNSSQASKPNGTSSATMARSSSS